MTGNEDQQGVMETSCGDGRNRRQGGGEDRRKKALPPLRYLIAGGRRKVIRRTEDRRQIVLLDHYSTKLFVAIVGILFLSLLDAFLTLYLIEHGSSEINPVMDYFLKKGPLVFTVAKYILTSVAVVIFVVLANSVLPRFNFHARKLLDYALIAFGSVIIWEVVLVLILAART